MEDTQQKLKLKREVGLMGAVSLIAGTMIGSGIFMTPQTVVGSIGSTGASLVVWASCGLLVILVSFCYAELGTVIQESGGEYTYILRTFGPVMAFMLVFSSVFFVRPAGIAGMGLGVAQYVVAPFYSDCQPPVLVVKCVAAAAILTLGTVNCINVRLSMSVQVFFMVAKVLALAVIIIGGIVLLIQGHTENFDDSFKNTNLGINPIGIAFYQGLWSYDGFNNLNYVTEELKRPEVRSAHQDPANICHTITTKASDNNFTIYYLGFLNPFDRTLIPGHILWSTGFTASKTLTSATLPPSQIFNSATADNQTRLLT